MCSILRKPFWISLSLISLCAILLILALCYLLMDLRLRILFAREQVQVFASMRKKAYVGNPQNAIECLEYTMNYYPSGTKQVQFSPLDEIVEISRKLTIQEILTLLREKSNKDFGNDPKVWLENRMVFGHEEE